MFLCHRSVVSSFCPLCTVTSPSITYVLYVQPMTAAQPKTQEAETQLTEERQTAAWQCDAATTAQNPTKMCSFNCWNLSLYSISLLYLGAALQ